MYKPQSCQHISSAQDEDELEDRLLKEYFLKIFFSL